MRVFLWLPIKLSFTAKVVGFNLPNGLVNALPAAPGILLSKK